MSSALPFETPDVTLDPVTVEVVRNKLDGIANEMELTLLKSSFSPIVKEGLDASASLFTLQGETLAQAVAIPIHLATLIPCIARILTEFPLESMREGDIYCMNDPYLGGTHLPDIAVVMPVFARGRPLAFAATMTHHQDVGGMAPGSVPTNATEVFQEGIRLPALKLREGERFNDTLLKILRRNVRIPDTFEGDLMAQVAACTVGVRRLSALAETYGDNHLTAIFGTLLDRSEAMTRNALRAIPGGTYSAVDFLDNDGIELDKRIRIEVAVTVGDGTMAVDFEGSSPQVRGPFNVVPSGSLAAACYVVRAITDPTIPTNGGCFRPITLNLPAGSIVNPREPAPVNSRTATIKRITGTILAAFAQAVPERVAADSGGELLVLAFGGERRDGTRYVTGELVAGGSGAGAAKDGVDVIETDATNCMNLPAEALELDAPIRVHRVGLRRDSGGAGARRGGLGTVREYEILHGEVRFTHRGERHFIAPKGRAGGHDGAMARTIIHHANGTEEIVPSKLVTTLRAGDRVIFETAGGGGYGPPDQRDPRQVAADVADGKISADGARAYARPSSRSEVANMPGNTHKLETIYIGPAPRLAVDRMGKGELVVFLHGIGGNRTNWRDQLPAFAERYHAVAWDARGYGLSDDYEGPLQYRHFCDDLLRLLDHFGAERGHLVGLSMGAAIVQDFYAYHPGRVASMVLADARPGFEAAFDPATRAEFLRLRLQPLREGKELADIAPAVARSLVGAKAGEAVYRRLVESIEALHKQSYIKTLEARGTGAPVFVPSKVAVPTLVVVGADDRLAPPAVAKSIADAIRGARLSVIPDAGHLSNIEQPALFNAIVLNFLAGTSGRDHASTT